MVTVSWLFLALLVLLVGIIASALTGSVDRRKRILAEIELGGMKAALVAAREEMAGVEDLLHRMANAAPADEQIDCSLERDLLNRALTTEREAHAETKQQLAAALALPDGAAR